MLFNRYYTWCEIFKCPSLSLYWNISHTRKSRIMINQMEKRNFVPNHRSQVCLFGVWLGKKLKFHTMDKPWRSSSTTVYKIDLTATTMLQSSAKLDINNTEQVVSFITCCLYFERIGSQSCNCGGSDTVIMT